MKPMISARLLTVSLTLLALASLSLRAGSAPRLRFTANFAPIRIHASPGQLVNRIFRLTLAKDQRSAIFQAKVEDWWASEDGHTSYYRESGTLSRSCAPWVVLNPVEARVDAAETLEVKVSVALPDSLEPGGYWCVLTVNEVPDPAVVPAGVGVSFVTSVSVGVFVFVEPIEREARLDAVDIQQDRVEVRLTNIGNTLLEVSGRIEFFRRSLGLAMDLSSRPQPPPGAGSAAATMPITHRTIVTEPIRSALLLEQLPDAEKLPSGRYLVRVILDIGTEYYIGVQKEIDIRRESSSTAPAGW